MKVKTRTYKPPARGRVFKGAIQGNQPVRTIPIGTGMFASRNILNIMRDMIREGSKHYVIRQVAERLTSGMMCDYDKAFAVWEFVTEKTDYQKDPRGYEYIKTPLVSLEEISKGIRPQLDCDDMTVLSLSLLASVGAKVSLRAASYNPNNKLTHVYGLVFIPKHNKWLPLDCVGKNGGPGWQKKPYTKILNWPVN